MKEKHSLLAIAYYNLGCQQEHLREYYKSMQSYLTALQLERQKTQFQGGNQTHNSRPHEPLVQEFLKSYTDMKRKVNLLHSASQSTATYSQGKKTFSGLNPKQVDNVSVSKASTA